MELKGIIAFSAGEYASACLAVGSTGSLRDSQLKKDDEDKEFSVVHS